MANIQVIWSKLKKFTDEQIDALGDNTPGVYRLSYKESDDQYYMFFVGESTNIKAALKDHLHGVSNPCIAIKKTKECAFKFSEIDSPDTRKAAVKLIYRHYQPACNSGEPEGSDDIIVNLT
jgi:hypothetical protein